MQGGCRISFSTLIRYFHHTENSPEFTTYNLEGNAATSTDRDVQESTA